MKCCPFNEATPFATDEAKKRWICGRAIVERVEREENIIIYLETIDDGNRVGVAIVLNDIAARLFATAI